MKFHIRITALLLILLFCGLSVWIFYSLRGHQPRQAMQSICETVYDKHYFGKMALRRWYSDCMSTANEIDHSATAADIIRTARSLFELISTSHLDVYTPSEDQVVWQGREETDSGMRARAIDGRFVVSRVYVGGPAAAAGVRVGDQILRIQNVGILSLDAISTARGEVQLSRLREGSEELLSVNIEPHAIQIDDAPQLRSLTPHIGHLEISSFRKDYFQKQKWIDLANRFHEYRSLVIDLRGNLGGDFVAVVRALSVFICEPGRHIGNLIRPQFTGGIAIVKDNATTEELYDLLIEHQILRLEVFSDYPCYRGAVTVLIDENTASVSEIFASAMARRARTRIWGSHSRGDMLLGVWYNLPLLGKGYTISVPEAIYQTPEGEIIESVGVEPSRRLFYRLSDARRGEDSWLLDAARAPY